MWIFTRYGFYSVARATAEANSDASADPNPVMVRARRKAHLENLQKRFKVLSGCQVLEWPDRDYRFRIIVGKETWATVIAELAREQTWSNFKDQVASSLSCDLEYLHSLHEVGSVMRNLQEGSLAPKFKAVFDDEPRNIIWNGITRPESLTKEGAKLREDLADRARDYDWPKVLAILAEHSELINAVRPCGHSLYTPLHQAAHGGASPEVVGALLKYGAWQTARNAEGLRPLDVALAKSHFHLQEILSPVFLQDVPTAVLSSIQQHFHEVIRGRAADFVREHCLRLPELDVMLEFGLRKFWFAVPGMYGGFVYWLAYDGRNAKLITESSCRLCGESGQRHEITASGSTLVDKEFD